MLLLSATDSSKWYDTLFDHVINQKCLQLFQMAALRVESQLSWGGRVVGWNINDKKKKKMWPTVRIISQPRLTHIHSVVLVCQYETCQN